MAAAAVAEVEAEAVVAATMFAVEDDGVPAYFSA
jgi:hypothetical protein